MSDTEELAEKVAEKLRAEGQDVKVEIRREGEPREARRNEVADRVQVILDRFHGLREPLLKRRRERLQRRRETLDGFLEGVRRSQRRSDEEDLKAENERLKQKLNNEKQQEEEYSRLTHHGILTTKKGDKDVAIEL